MKENRDAMYFAVVDEKKNMFLEAQDSSGFLLLHFYFNQIK